MRCLLITIIVSFYFHVNFAQENVFLDVNREEITNNDFLRKWRDKELLLTRWDSIGNEGRRYAILKKGLYLKATYDYNYIKIQIENIINRHIPDSSNIILEYYYKDDLCTSWWDNNWTKAIIKRRKDFTDPIRNNLKKDNFFYVVLFEKGMELMNKPKHKNEYFFKDTNNYFRNLLFTNPTMCGSFALIKSNGETLIRNGEGRADWMAQHLKPENWNLFFEPQD